MALLKDIDHSTGDLSQYDTTVIDGGDLSVSAIAGMAGSPWGMQALIDDTNVIYGIANISASGNFFGCRFYFDPNSLTMSNGNIFYLWFAEISGSGYTWIQFRLSGTSYQIRYRIYNDGRSAIKDTSWYTITDAPHMIEIRVTRASSAVASDATGELWIDGELKETESGIDLFDDWPYTAVRFGVASAPQAAVSGTLYLDQLRITDDGHLIGKHSWTGRAEMGRPDRMGGGARTGAGARTGVR